MPSNPNPHSNSEGDKTTRSGLSDETNKQARTSGESGSRSTAPEPFDKGDSPVTGQGKKEKPETDQDRMDIDDY